MTYPNHHHCFTLFWLGSSDMLENECRNISHQLVRNVTTLDPETISLRQNGRHSETLCHNSGCRTTDGEVKRKKDWFGASEFFVRC